MDIENKFYNLKTYELERKFQKLVEKKDNIKVWQKNGQKILYRIKAYEEKNNEYKLIFFSESQDIDITICFSKIYYNFKCDNMEYFGRGHVSAGKEDGTLELQLSETVFRAEKRDNQRLLTFPHHQVYIYYNLSSDQDNIEDFKSSNVLSLNKVAESKKIEEKKLVLAKLNAQIDEDINELCGFRVFDISKNGTSFIIDAAQSFLFENGSKAQSFITFNEKIFTVDQGEIVYNVDYLSSASGKKKKVGINYKTIPKLKDFIDLILNKGNQKDIIFNDFENFVKDN